jgi:WD40 repeat protein
VDFAQLSSILSDAWQFVAMFYDAIDWCPGHIYTCALSLAPICSLVKLYAHKDDSSCLISPREPKWDCPYALSGFADVATFSCDGALLILSMWDKMEIRDAATGRLLRTLEDAKRIVSADVHPSNHSFVTISTNGLVQEWGLSGDAGLLWTGEFPGARKSFVWWLWNGSKVVYNADGTKIVCYSDGVDSIHVWPTGGCLPLSTRLVMPPATTVETLSSDCGREHVVALLITKGKPAVVKFWNIDTGEEIKSLQIKSDEIESAVFAKRSTMLVTSHQTKICMWDLEGDCFTHTMTIPSPSHARYTMKPLKSYVPKKRFAWPVAVSPSGGVIAAGCRDDAIRFYDAEAGALPAVYRGHYLITSLHFSPQGDRLVSSSEGDKTTRVWDTTKEALSSDLSSDCCFTRIVFSPNGKYIAAIAKADTRVLVYSGQTGICLTTLTRHTDHVMALAFSLDGSILATISKDGLICLWDMGVDTALPSTPSQSWTIESIKSVDMAFNASGNLLAIVCVVDDLSFVVAVHEISDRDWAGNGVESFRSKPSNGNPPHLIRFEPDEPLVRVRYVDPDVNVRIWDRMNDSVEECAYDESVHSTWVFPYEIDGKWGWGKREEWIVSNRDKRRLLWLPEHRKPLEHCMDVHGDRLAIGSKEGILTLVDMSRLKGDQL